MTRDVLVSALKEWTGNENATIIFDSTVDEFTADGLFDTVRGKRNIAVVGFTTEGDVFGGFYSVAMTDQREFIYDPSIFAFSFESHGRCKTPQRFAVKDDQRCRKYVHFNKNDSDGWFVDVGGNFGNFFLGNEKSATWCYDLSYEYVGIEDTTLTGKTHPERFTCTRVVAVHLQ